MSQGHRVASPGGRRKLAGLLLVLLGVVVIGIGPAAAQRTTFVPSVFVEEARSGNVAYLGAGGGQTTPDWMTRLGVSLALRREGKSGQAGLRYGGYYEKYEKYSPLDHSEHSLGVNLASPADQRSTMEFTTSYNYGQVQGNPASIEAADRFLSQRVNRQVLRGTARYDRRGSGRWSLGATASGSQYRFRQIQGDSSDAASDAPEDRREIGATAGARLAMSPRHAIGWLYGYTKYDLESSGMEEVQNLSMTFDLGIFKTAAVGFQVGAFQRRKSTTTGGPDTVERGPSLQARGGVNITKTGKRTMTSFVADRSASNGGTLNGTSTDTTVGVTVTNVRPIRWYWTASGRYVLRESTQAPQGSTSTSDVQTAAGGGTVERRFRNGLALRLTAVYVRQVSGNAALAGTAPTGAIGLVWNPRGTDVGSEAYGKIS